jgi:hypothetical protein
MEWAEFFCVARGTDGAVVSFGSEQIKWLLDNHLVKPTLQPRVFEGVTTAAELNRWVMTQPRLRNCDFCHITPSTFRVECKSFHLTLGPNAGGRLGGEDRPVWACKQCGTLLRVRNRKALIRSAINEHIRRAERLVGPLDRLLAERVIRPMITEVVDGVLKADPRVRRVIDT